MDLVLFPTTAPSFLQSDVPWNDNYHQSGDFASVEQPDITIQQGEEIVTKKHKRTVDEEDNDNEKEESKKESSPAKKRKGAEKKMLKAATKMKMKVVKGKGKQVRINVMSKENIALLNH